VRHGAQSTGGRSRPFGGPAATIAAVEHTPAGVAHEPGTGNDAFGADVEVSDLEVSDMDVEVPGGTGVGQPETEAPDIDASLLDSIEERLADVERALARLDEGSYGTCEVCGATVDDAVLVEAPATRFCPDHLPLSLG